MSSANDPGQSTSGESSSISDKGGQFSIVRVLAIVLGIIVIAGGGYGVWIATKKPVVLMEFTGRIMFDGKPVTSGGISTMRLDDELDGAVSALDEDGRFSLRTNGEPGAYVGRHKVVISAMTPTMPPRTLIPSTYGSMATTPFIIDVSENPLENQREFVLEGTIPPAPADSGESTGVRPPPLYPLEPVEKANPDEKTEPQETGQPDEKAEPEAKTEPEPNLKPADS